MTSRYSQENFDNELRGVELTDLDLEIKQDLDTQQAFFSNLKPEAKKGRGKMAGALSGKLDDEKGTDPEAFDLLEDENGDVVPPLADIEVGDFAVDYQEPCAASIMPKSGNVFDLNILADEIRKNFPTSSLVEVRDDLGYIEIDWSDMQDTWSNHQREFDMRIIQILRKLQGGAEVIDHTK